MNERNESSSLIALRGLREMERQRMADEARARAEAEEARRMEDRLAAERLARAEAERASALAAEAAAEEHLRRELGAAQEQLEHLRVRLASAQAAVSPAPTPVVIKPRPLGWMAACAAVSTLAGLFAVQWATTHQQSAASAPTPVAPLCPPAPGPAPSAPSVSAAPTAAPIAPTPTRLPTRHSTKPTVTPVVHTPDRGPKCDGTDPLCGLDTEQLDDVRGGGRRRPR